MGALQHLLLQWQQLVRMNGQQLASYDVALVNLACAAGLPGSERIDVEGCVRRLDLAARVVAQYTEHYLPDFRKRPQDYQNSEAYYRALALITVLQRDLGIRYNPDKTSEDAKFDLEDTFAHGVLTGKGGTCASLPVVYVAVGRRLGYPMRLVDAPCHLLCRWDEPGGERFNIEATNLGMNTPSDNYYREGRYPLSAGQQAASRFLQSQTPREELAGFLAQRGYRWLDHARYKEAAESFIWASARAPDHKPHAQSAVETLDRWKKRIKGLLPPNFPVIRVNMPLARRYPDVPAWVEKEHIGNEGREKLLQDPEFVRKVVKPLWASPQRRPPQIPQQIVINVLN
jgi:hypothetical protein